MPEDRCFLRSTHFAAILALVLIVALVWLGVTSLPNLRESRFDAPDGSALTTAAQYELDSMTISPQETTTDVSLLPDDLIAEHRSAFALMAQAERAVAAVLMLTEDPPNTLPEESNATAPAERLSDVAAFMILEPSTLVLLATTYGILGDIAEALDDLERILAEDIAEELTISEDVLERIEVEEDGELLEEPEDGDRTLPEVANVLEDLDIEAEIAGGRCGDLDTLVQTARGDIVRALGAPGRFEPEDRPVDPDARLLALDALRVHHLRMRITLVCLAEFLP